MVERVGILWKLAKHRKRLALIQKRIPHFLNTWNKKKKNGMKNTQQAMVFFGKILAGMLYGGAAVCKTVSKDLVGSIPTPASFGEENV